MENIQSIENLILEMRRGVIVLAVLSQCAQEQYGYSLMKSLANKGLDIDQGTLYPLLRRLETQGLLSSSWRLEDARPRRYYVISKAGKEILPELIKEWESMVQMMRHVLD
ncbi:MAG TPA: PadR family transcriptional regulator [Anaerolineales bacterium]